MPANYDQPLYVEKRVRYFDGQFLKDQDFVDEQKYHLDRQRRLYRFLNVAGICEGLTLKPDANKVTVEAGTALDRQGQQIVLSTSETVNLSNYKGRIVDLLIAYQQEAADPASEGSTGNSRWHEKPKITAILAGETGSQEITPPFKTLDENGNEIEARIEDSVRLGRLTVDPQGNVNPNENEPFRQYSGVRLPAANGSGPTLRSGKTSSLAILAGDLKVTGTISGSIDAGDIKTGQLKIEQIPNLDASKMTAGTLDVARIPNLDASKVVSGSFDAARIPGLDASKMITGTLDVTRIPNLDASKVVSGSFDAARIPNLDASKITAGTLNTDRIPNLSASKITTGTIAGSLNVTSNVGIGGSSGPSSVLHIMSGVDAGLTTHGYFLLGDVAGENIVMDNNEIMARKNSEPAPLYLQHDGGEVYVNRQRIAGNPGSVAPTPSDIRFKKDIDQVVDALKKVTQLRGITYCWNETGLEYFTKDIEKNFSAGPKATQEEHQKLWGEERDKRYAELDKTYLGLIAQEVEAIIPEVVRTDEAGYKSILYPHLTALLIEAIKEQHQLLQTLLIRVNHLESSQQETLQLAH